MDYEGRRGRKEERKKLINDLEKGLEGKPYLSSMDNLEEVDMLLKDRFNLIDYPYEYTEEETQRLRSIYESNTPEGEVMRASVEKDEELEEEAFDEEETYIEEEIEEEEEEEEEFGKTVKFRTSDIDTGNIVEGKISRR